MTPLCIVGCLVAAVAAASAACVPALEAEGESCLLQTYLDVAHRTRKDKQLHAAPEVPALSRAQQKIAAAMGQADLSAFLDPNTCVPQADVKAKQQAYAVVCSIGCTQEYLDSDGREWAQFIRHQDRQRDILILLAEGDPTRPAVERFVAEMNDSLGRVHLILQPDDLARPPAPMADLMEKSANCCGWREMRNLWIWNLTEYDRVMYIEMDVRMLEPVEELWNCEYPWVGTIGGFAPLNAGWYLFRPGADTFAALVSTMEATRYDHATGWGGLGQPRPYHPKLGRPVGSDTMQGFLYYYYFTLGHGGRMVDMAVYNYQICTAMRYKLLTEPTVDPRIYAGCWDIHPELDSDNVKIVHKTDPGVDLELARVNASVTAQLSGQ